MLNLNFLKDLFKVGMTKEQFVGAYSELFNSETGVSDAQLDGMSIFDADKKEAVASDLFDMLNIKKSADGEEETLDADEITAFSNFDKNDGENNLTVADVNVLLKNYSETLLSETKLDTPENMYEQAMSKPNANGDTAGAYLQSLDFQISAVESLMNNRQSTSTQTIMDYQNEMNELIQNDNTISNELKAKYRKENEKLNSLVRKQNQLDSQIKEKQSELDNATSEYQNIQANIEYAQKTENDEADYTSDLSNAQKNIESLNDSMSSLQSAYSKLGSQITRSQSSLKSMRAEVKAQNQELKAKMDAINNKIETEQNACIKDVKNYNNHINTLKEAQTYAIQRIQTEAAANISSSSVSTVGNGDDTYVYDESNYDASAIAALEERWKSKSKNNPELNHEFFVKVTAIAQDLKCDPNALLAVMNSESGINAHIQNKHGGASGLIQFMPSTAKALGTTTDALKKMSATDQLDYVAKFFQMNKKMFKVGDGPMSAGDLYSLVFLPGRANREVLTSKGEKFYNANAGLDIDGDGQITKSDLTNRVNKFMA